MRMNALIGAVLGAWALGALPAAPPADAQTPPRQTRPAAAAPAPSGQTAPADQPYDDPYTVAGVAVDVTAGTATAAREKALADGQREAYRRLIQRLVPAKADQDRLSQLDDVGIGELVQGIEIADERRSGVRYIASLTVAFRPTGVRQRLAALGVQSAEPARSAAPRTVLVLPLFLSPDGATLWDDPNPWRDAWGRQAPPAGAVRLVVPLGDVADLAEVSTEQAKEGSPDPLSTIGRRYAAAEVVVAQARIEPDAAKKTTTVEITALRLAALNKGWTVIARYPNVEPGGLERIYETAVGRVAAAAVELTRGDATAGSGGEEKLTATVLFDKLEDWLEVRRRLGRVPMIRRNDVASVSRERAVVNLFFIGKPDQLRDAMAQRDLDLSQSETGGWQLKLGRPSGQAPATPPR